MKPTKLKSIFVILPCKNEEQGLEKMLSGFDPKLFSAKGYTVNFLVVDNGSTDKTTAIAKKYGIPVIYEPKPGKGNAVKTGFSRIPPGTDFVVMMDGDNTYQLSELFRMIEPIESKFCSVVVGSRLSGKMKKYSIRKANRIGNWFFTFLVRVYYLANLTDVLSGYFAFHPNVVKLLAPHLTSDGFAIEMEIIAKSEKLGFDLYSVPITYEPREGRSKLNNLTDGAAILSMFFKTLHWTPDAKLKQQLSVLTF